MCNSIFLLQHITTSLSFCCNNIIFRRYNLGGVALSCHKRYICRGRSIECLVLFLFYGNIPSCFASCYSSFILGWFNFCVFVVIEPFFMFVLCRLVKIWTIYVSLFSCVHVFVWFDWNNVCLLCLILTVLDLFVKKGRKDKIFVSVFDF